MGLRRGVGLASVFFLAACTGSGPANPATPTGGSSVRPHLVVTVKTSPLTAVPDPAGVPNRYRVAAEVVFTETAGAAARITRLRVDITGSSGWARTETVEVEIPVPAGGAASHALTTMVDNGAPGEHTRWRLVTTAADLRGQALEVAATDSELRFPSPFQPVPVPDAVLIGAGDIAYCGKPETEATARLLDRLEGTVITLGDNAYPHGTPKEFTECYHPTWGRHRERTYPSPGNHDYDTADGAPYYAYFGPQAGPAGLGYYTFTAGTWQVFSLNSNIPAGAGTAQFEWLKAGLAASKADCTLAYWHHSVFSSGTNGPSPRMRDVWRLLDAAGVDVVLSAHEHLYERFAPQDVDGRADPAGLRQFTVGTGGASLYDLRSRHANSEVFERRTWGVIRMTLKTGGYDWEFVPIAGQTFRDAGSGVCVAR